VLPAPSAPLVTVLAAPLALEVPSEPAIHNRQSLQRYKGAREDIPDDAPLATEDAPAPTAPKIVVTWPLAFVEVEIAELLSVPFVAPAAPPL